MRVLVDHPVSLRIQFEDHLGEASIHGDAVHCFGLLLRRDERQIGQRGTAYPVQAEHPSGSHRPAVGGQVPKAVVDTPVRLHHPPRFLVTVVGVVVQLHAPTRSDGLPQECQDLLPAGGQAELHCWGLGSLRADQLGYGPLQGP